MPRKLVHLGQVAVQAQAADAHAGQADIQFLEQERPVMFHRKALASLETKIKSFLC
jgi:hypothetical protein